ncbi:LRRN4 C-terminal-like protein [Conger conger]|uniref:LRRN4 C-terminal-like protein n=1 Tax=Conger conger TaxID=82655 RepID=UPI002A5AE344|nr:LRRN4 C-terminal-like protein [Conger conger]
MAAPDFPALSLLIALVFLLNGYLADPLKAPEGNSTSARPMITPFRIRYVTGPSDYDYKDEEDENKPTSIAQPQDQTPKLIPRPCDYNPCQDQQVPCAQLAALSDCLCPGVTGPQELPEAPSLGKIVQEGSETVVTWCAPHSSVSSYRVVVDGGEPLVFGERLRRAVLGGLAAGARVCVEAVNDAGTSTPSPQSCKEYEPPGDEGLSLRAGIIGGGLGFILLLSLSALLLWKFNSCRKPGSDSEGLGNLSYSSEGPL